MIPSDECRAKEWGLDKDDRCGRQRHDDLPIGHPGKNVKKKDGSEGSWGRTGKLNHNQQSAH